MQDTRSPECAQTGGNTSSGTPSATADTVTPALPPALQAPAPALNAATLPLLNGAQLLPPGNGAPQLPAGLLGYPAQQQSQQALQVQSQLLANMAVLPASAQVLLAQNAAWLAVQASTQGGVPDLSSQQASFTPTSFGTSFASSASIAPNGQVRSLGRTLVFWATRCKCTKLTVPVLAGRPLGLERQPRLGRQRIQVCR